MAITIKNEREIGLMREASQVVALVHDRIEAAIAPGVTTQELDDIARDTLRRRPAPMSLFLGHLGFTGRICASVNEEIVHGIPGKRMLRDGDIISVDVGARVGGYCGDSAWTYRVSATLSTRRGVCCEVTERSLYLGIAQAVAGSASPRDRPCRRAVRDRSVASAWSANTAVTASVGRCGKIRTFRITVARTPDRACEPG